MASVFRKGRPEYIPVILTLETKEEFGNLMYILREAQKENIFGRKAIKEAHFFEDLLSRFID